MPRALATPTGPVSKAQQEQQRRFGVWVCSRRPQLAGSALPVLPACRQLSLCVACTRIVQHSVCLGSWLCCGLSHRCPCPPVAASRSAPDVKVLTQDEHRHPLLAYIRNPTRLLRALVLLTLGAQTAWPASNFAQLRYCGVALCEMVYLMVEGLRIERQPLLPLLAKVGRGTQAGRGAGCWGALRHPPEQDPQKGVVA